MPQMDFASVVQIIFASIFVLFLPGFTLSFTFFSQGKIDLLERIALSFALSISIVPLLAFYLNLLGVPIRKETVFVEILLIVMTALLILVIKKEVKFRFPEILRGSEDRKI